jgi:hypothetical protein
MGFWPFGRDKATIESASRVVDASLEDKRRVRGKLTLHFAKACTQADADTVADRVAGIATAVLLDKKDHTKVIGAESELSREVEAKYPKDAPEARSVELAALHVVGDMSLSDELRRASVPAMRAGREGTPAPGAVNSSAPPRRRGSSSSMRAISTLLLPPGSPPSAIAQFIAPLAVETAARLLIAALRAHDLIAVRKVTIDDGSAEMLASLVSANEAPVGGYDVGRAGEIGRWKTALGDDVVGDLTRLCNAVATKLARVEMATIGVPDELANEIEAALVATAFTTDKPSDLELEALVTGDLPTTLALRAATALHHETAGPMQAALAPIVLRAAEDMRMAASVVKHAVPAPTPPEESPPQ